MKERAMAKKAFLCGVNRYWIPGTDLRGCVNGVESMASVLTEIYEFDDADITMIEDDLDHEDSRRCWRGIRSSSEPKSFWGGLKTQRPHGSPGRRLPSLTTHR